MSLFSRGHEPATLHCEHGVERQSQITHLPIYVFRSLVPSMRDRRLQLDIRLCLLLVCPLVAWSAAAQHARPAANMSDSEFLQHMGDLVSKLHLVKVQPEQGSVGHTLGTANCAKYSGFDNLNNLKAMPHINVDVDVRRHHTYREVVDLLLSVTWPREKHRMKWSDYFHFRVERTGGTTTANLEATVHSGPALMRVEAFCFA
eukprot:scaffold1471_cov413-Prasinococcus_capsulatus_cf.AAC.8